MLTYVINTSENKVFDSNLLFELVGYSQIRWKHCSLDKIDLCATEICAEEKSKILSTGEYRVVVLVDFFGFPHTDPAKEETAGEYVELYKGFLEYYLMENLFGTLKQNNIPAKACEIYYIQYVAYEPLAVNRMAAEQTARLFGLAEEEKLLKKQRHQKGEDGIVYPRAAESSKKHEMFLLPCSEGVELQIDFCKKKGQEEDYDEEDEPLTEGKGMSFYEFFTYFCNHRDDARKFGITVHKPYVTFGDASRAAYDALSLSLYLVHLYERRDDVAPDTEIRRPDDRVFVDVLRTSLRKVHSARVAALKNDCRYYPLNVQHKKKDPEKAVKSNKKAAKAKKPPRLTEEAQYLQICRLAGEKGLIETQELQKERDALMKQYLEQRDFARSKEKEEQDADFVEIEEDLDIMVEQCPSALEYKNAVDDKKKEIATLLEESLSEDDTMQSFEEEKEEATEIYTAYKKAKACQTRNIIGDTVMLILMLIAMIVPYGLLTFSGKPFTGITVTMYVIAIAMFGGLYVFLFLGHLIRSVGEIRRQRVKLELLYQKCMEKRNKSLDNLRKRYSYDLIEIEELRKDIWEIAARDRKNAEKNHHVELHRAMLERVENQLSGMLNNFGEKPDITLIEDVRDEFKIEKPIAAAENKIYKIFSMDAIDAMFKQKGEEMR